MFPEDWRVGLMADSVISLPEAIGEWIGHHFPLDHYFRYRKISLKGIFILNVFMNWTCSAKW